MSTGTLPFRLDFHDPVFQTDPWPVYDWHRQNAPVIWSDEMKCFFVFGYRNAHHALTSPEFTAFHPFRRSRAAFGASALDSEGSEHRRLRGSLAGSFRPRSVAGYSESIVQPLVGQLLGEMLDRGDPTFADELAWRLPTRVACRLLGLPESDDDRLLALMRPLLLYVDHAPVSLTEVIARRDELRDYLRDHARADEAHPSMMHMLLGDENLDDTDALNNGVLLLAAATETTGASIVNLLARVAGQPGLFQALRTDPDRSTSIVAETLRHEPPLHVTLRYAATDLEFAGVSIPQGAAIQVCLASANRDPEVFERPHEWDDGPRRATTLTFGMGRHHCLGMGVAQLELETILRILARRLDALWVESPLPPVPTGRTFRRVPGLRLGLRHAEGSHA